MLIPNDEISYKDKVGSCGNADVWAISTIGGLHLIEKRNQDGKREIIGAGSHRAVARYLAKKKCPDLVWSVLEKSSDPQLSDFEDVLPFWEEVVNRANARR